MYSRVSLQVEGVVEALATERTKVPFDLAMVLHVAVQQPLQRKLLLADLAHVSPVVGHHSWKFKFEFYYIEK